MKRTIIFSLVIFCLFPVIKAQNSLVHNIWNENRNYYNPSASPITFGGAQYAASVYMKHKFVDTDPGTWRKPNDLMLNFAGETSCLPGFYSAGYQYDGHSFYNNHSLSGGYAYDLSLGKAGNFSFGARLILNYHDMNWDKFYMGKPENSRNGYLKPDFDLGISYRVMGLNIGLSTKNAAASRTVFGDGIILTSNHRDFYEMISYDFRLRGFTIAPYVFAYQHRRTGIDAGLNFGMKDRFDVSYAFRIKELRSIFSARAFVYKGLFLGMAITTKGYIYSDNDLDMLIGFAF